MGLVGKEGMKHKQSKIERDRGVGAKIPRRLDGGGGIRDSNRPIDSRITRQRYEGNSVQPSPLDNGDAPPYSLCL